MCPPVLRHPRVVPAGRYSHHSPRRCSRGLDDGSSRRSSQSPPSPDRFHGPAPRGLAPRQIHSPGSRRVRQTLAWPSLSWSSERCTMSTGGVHPVRICNASATEKSRRKRLENRRASIGGIARIHVTSPRGEATGNSDRKYAMIVESSVDIHGGGRRIGICSCSADGGDDGSHISASVTVGSNSNRYGLRRRPPSSPTGQTSNRPTRKLPRNRLPRGRA